MAKKKEQVSFDDIVWVINNLPPKDLEVIDDMELDIEHINNFLTEIVENGFSVSFKWDDYSDCHSITLICREKGFNNTGYAFSARGEDFKHCVAIAMYKYFEVAKENLSNLTEVKQKRPKYG